jgi:hypothetical protein
MAARRRLMPRMYSVGDMTFVTRGDRVLKEEPAA